MRACPANFVHQQPRQLHPNHSIHVDEGQVEGEPWIDHVDGDDQQRCRYPISHQRHLTPRQHPSHLKGEDADAEERWSDRGVGDVQQIRPASGPQTHP